MSGPRVLAVVVAAIVACVAASAAPSATRPNSPSCLRGRWVATTADSNRILRQLVRIPNVSVAAGQINVQFTGGLMIYSTSGLVVRMDGGALVMTATGRWHTQAPYTARRGVVALERGMSVLDFDEFTGTKDGRTVTVPGGPGTRRATPAGETPFECNASRLRWRIPALATGGAGWATFRRR